MLNSSTRIAVLIVVLLLMVLAAVWWFGNSNTIETENNGLVDNTPPPSLEDGRPSGVPESWRETTTNIARFYYPENISSDYVSAVDWPPTVQIVNEPYACTEAGEETERAGGTDVVSVNGREYCRTVVAEGAAGSVYRQYAYAFPHGGETAILTFSARFPQCANYEEEESADCEAQQAAFDSDDLADSIVDAMEWR